MILTGLLAAPLFPMAEGSVLVAGALPVWGLTMLAMAALGMVTGLAAIAVWQIPAELEETASTRESRRDSLDVSIMSSASRQRMFSVDRERVDTLRASMTSSSTWPPALQTLQPQPSNEDPRKSIISMSTVATHRDLQEMGAPVL